MNPEGTLPARRVRILKAKSFKGPNLIGRLCFFQLGSQMRLLDSHELQELRNHLQRASAGQCLRSGDAATSAIRMGKGLSFKRS